MFDLVIRGTAEILRALLGPLPLPRHWTNGQVSPGPWCEPLEKRALLSATLPSVVAQPAVPASAPRAAASSQKTGPSIAPDLSARALSPTQVLLSWRKLKVSKILILGRLDQAKSLQRLAVLPASSTRYVVSGLKAGHSYTFTVKAVAKNQRGSASSAVAISTPQGASPAKTSFSRPIVITHGGTYSGNWQSLKANIPAVRIVTDEPVIIENSIIRSRGTLISAVGQAVNVTVRHTSGYGLNPGVRGLHAGRFLDVDGFANVLVEQNYLQGTAGIYLYHYRGDGTAGQTVQVLQNQALNIDGRESNGRGGYLPTPTSDYVQFFQINGVHGLRGARVAWNQVINQPGKSLVEDNISIFNTTGTPDDPFEIDNNYIRGAYPLNPAHNSDFTGGGIMLSDIRSAYIVAHDNQVLDTTNYGMAISAGHDNAFYANRILSAGVLPDGQAVAAQNVGAYIWNSHQATDWGNNTGHDNFVGWMRGGVRNDSWTPDASSWDNNEAAPGPITLDALNQEWTIWQGKLTEAGIALGP